MDTGQALALLRRHSTTLSYEAMLMEDKLRQGDTEGAKLHLLRVEEALRILTRIVAALVGPDTQEDT